MFIRENPLTIHKRQTCKSRELSVSKYSVLQDILKISSIVSTIQKRSDRKLAFRQRGNENVIRCRNF